MSAMDGIHGDAGTAVQENPPAANLHQAKTKVLHNSRIACGGMFLLAIGSLCIGVCMVFAAIPLVFPLNHMTFLRGMGAVQWSFGGVMMVMMCPGLWKWAMGMAHRKVVLDARGIDFVLGTKKQPIELSMPWEQVASVQKARAGNAMEFTVQGRDGSFARFTSYSFFRPRRVARLIAERAGLTVR